MALIIKFSDFLDKPKDPNPDFVKCKFGSTSCTHEATHKNNHGVDMCFECLKINAKHQQRRPKMVLRQWTEEEQQMMYRQQQMQMNQQLQQQHQQQQMAYQQQQMQMMGNIQQANTPAQSLPRNHGFFGMSWRSIVGLPPESQGSD
ncbi:MAG: hypothetical protein CMB45_05570 [Euryarchaeota archaeon]|nr:hypothetical protein [Euryarchaeota archaeon]MBK38443.1 hypothetical protein [Euryarchaeota archaeon]|tara:strand:- start:187 stop:624 length:438 start_codon:yes stop_codon:yes gene_type:complete